MRSGQREGAWSGNIVVTRSSTARGRAFFARRSTTTSTSEDTTRIARYHRTSWGVEVGKGSSRVSRTEVPSDAAMGRRKANVRSRNASTGRACHWEAGSIEASSRAQGSPLGLVALAEHGFWHVSACCPPA